MKTWLIVIGTFFMTSPVFAAPPKILNLESGFKAWVSESKNSDFDKQLASWIKNVESQAPEVYAELLSKNDPAKLDAERTKKAKQSFPFFIKHSQEIIDQFEIFETKSKPQLAQLSKQFNAYDLSNIEVIALPGFFIFDGQVIQSKGRIYALFGMDMSVEKNLNPNILPQVNFVNNLPVLVSHEFTHALHFAINPEFLKDGPSSTKFYSPLWEEGLAEVQSQMLNPGMDLPNIFIDKNLAAQCTSTNVKKWAGYYLADANGPGEKMESAAEKWFSISSEKPNELGVMRAGYCLAYNVIVLELCTHSMQDLLKMKRDEAYSLLKSALESFR